MGRELKTNQRSIRFSDEIADIINSQVGDNFNQKFERLVYNCYMLVEQKQKIAAEVQKDIDEKRNQYTELCKQLRDVDDLMRTLKSLQHYGEIAVRGAELIGKGLDYRGLPKEM